jgi:very-short-patch-repair endonuclease
MTEAEIKLWSQIRLKRLKGLQFYRQKPIGKYIVDFYCPHARLVIEVDGSQHNFGRQQEKDIERDVYLAKTGLRVIRYNDMDVLTNIEGVIEHLLEELNQI